MPLSFFFFPHSSLLLPFLHLLLTAFSITSFSPFSFLSLTSRNKSSFLGRSRQSGIRLSHGWLLRENADLLSSLLLFPSFFSLFVGGFLPSALLLFSLSRIAPSLPDCNNSNNDNNGDGPCDGDVKKHNIRITNTLSNQWPSSDLRGRERTWKRADVLLKSRICVCVCERACACRRKKKR